MPYDWYDDESEYQYEYPSYEPEPSPSYESNIRYATSPEPAPSAPSGGGSDGRNVNEDQFLSDLSSRYGASVEASDAARIREYEEGIARGTTRVDQLQDYMRALEEQYAKRGAPTGHREYDSQSGRYANIGADPRTEAGYRETRDLSGENIFTQFLRMLQGGAATQQAAAPSATPPKTYTPPTTKVVHGHPPDAFRPDGTPMSPMEYAAMKGNQAALQKATDAFYGLTPEEQVKYNDYVNWYQPNSWSWLTTPSGGAPAPTGATPGTGGVPGRPNMPGSPTGLPPRREYSSRPEGREGQDMFRGIYNTGMQNINPLSAQLMGFLNSRVSRENDAYQRYLDYIQGRVPELQAEPFSATEEAGRRVAAFDNLNRQRNMAKQRVIEQLGARGLGGQSGIINQAIQEVDRAFDTMQAQNENQLLLEGTQIRDQRRQQADELMQRLTGFGFTSSGLGSELTGGLGTFANMALGGAGGFSDLVRGLYGLDEQAWGNDVNEDLQRSALANEVMKLMMQF